MATVNPVMLEALKRLPIHVFNLTSDDFNMWPDLVKLDLPETRFISTNLLAPEGVKSPDRFTILEIPQTDGDGKMIRVGFLGLTAPAMFQRNSGYTLVDAREAVDTVKKSVKKKVHCWIVVGDFSEQLAQTLAVEHRDVFAVLRMERRFRLPQPKQVGNAVLLSSVERGRYLGRLTITFDSSGGVKAYEPEFTKLDSQVPEDPEFVRLAEEARNQLP